MLPTRSVFNWLSQGIQDYETGSTGTHENLDIKLYFL